MVNKWLMRIWDTKLPRKIRIFLRQVYNDKIQSAEQLKRRNWLGTLPINSVNEMKKPTTYSGPLWHSFLEQLHQQSCTKETFYKRLHA
jgi:hypothetical protein